MSQRKTDCLMFQTDWGQLIPCSAEWVTLELIGEAASAVDPETLRSVAAAVLHYFKYELHREYVSVAEFAAVLERGLGVVGLSILPAGPPPPLRVKETDLLEAIKVSGGGELFFFPYLRSELRRHIGDSPQIVRFNSLRACVKQLLGAGRWSRRCQALSDQIVAYLRNCLQTDTRNHSCTLMVH